MLENIFILIHFKSLSETSDGQPTIWDGRIYSDVLVKSVAIGVLNFSSADLSVQGSLKIDNRCILVFMLPVLQINLE